MAEDSNDIVVAEGTDFIDDYAFYKNTSLTSVSIPDSVRKIGMYAFYGCESIKSVIIPEGITEIREKTFARCKTLESVAFPKSLKRIENAAFFGCKSLKSLVLPEGLEIIGDNAFSECSALKDVEIPSSVKVIGKWSFRLCAIELCTLPSELEFLGKGAFQECYSLWAIEIPPKIKRIENRTFYDCRKIEWVYLSANLLEIGKEAFSRCNSLERIYIKEEDDDESKLVSIEKWAFRECNSLKRICLPLSVKKLDKEIFYSCPSLEEITFQSFSLRRSPCNTALYLSAMDIYENCPNLKSLYIDDIYNQLEGNGFAGYRINKDEEPYNLLTIDGVKSFLWLEEKLEDYEVFSIPEGVELLAAFSFPPATDLWGWNCSLLELPRTLRTIEDYALSDFWMLENIEYNGTVKEWEAIKKSNLWYDKMLVEKIVCTDGCVPLPDLKMKETGICCARVGLEKVVLGNVPIAEKAFFFEEKLKSVRFSDDMFYIDCEFGGLSKVGKLAFYKCTNLMYVELPSCITCIDSEAFEFCQSLQKVVLPPNLLHIEKSAFTNCYSLETLEIPKSVTSIGRWAFSGCKSLTRLFIPNGVTEIAIGTFIECYSLKIISIPKSVRVIGEAAFSNCTSLKSFEIPDGVTQISYATFNRCVNLKTVEIPKSVKKIDDKAFAFCESIDKIFFGGSLAEWETVKKAPFWAYGSSIDEIYCLDGKAFIEKIVATKKGVLCLKPISFATIGNVPIAVEAFANNEKLSSVTVSNNIKYDMVFEEPYGIGERAFYKCSSLGHVELPSCITFIGNEAFKDCTYLERIVISSDLSYIGESAFEGDYSLKEVIFSSKVEIIEKKAFYKCPKLQGLQLPEGLTRIGENAFYSCLNLVSIIVLPESVKKIEERAFYYCPSITKVVIPRGVECISLAAFSWCISLTDVQYTGTVDEWKKLYRYSDLNEYRVPFYKCPLEFVHCLDGNVRLPDFARSEGKSFLIDIFNSNIRSFSVPYGTNTIPEHAFTLCTKLESVEFPDTLEYIKELAFWECISLKEIVLPDNVKKLDGFAFFHCTSLESVSIPSAMSLNSCAFMECRNLKKIVFRGTLEEWEKKTIGRHEVDWWNKDFFPHNVPVYCDDGLTSLEIYLCPNADANLLNFFVPIGYPAAIYLRFPDLSDLVKNIVGVKKETS